MAAIERVRGQRSGNFQAVFSIMIGGFAAVIGGCMMLSVYVWPHLPVDLHDVIPNITPRILFVRFGVGEQLLRLARVPAEPARHQQHAIDRAVRQDRPGPGSANVAAMQAPSARGVCAVCRGEARPPAPRRGGSGTTARCRRARSAGTRTSSGCGPAGGA